MTPLESKVIAALKLAASLEPYIDPVQWYASSYCPNVFRKIREAIAEIEPVPDHLREVYDGDTARVATVSDKYEPQGGQGSYTWWDHSRLGYDHDSHLPRELYAVLKYGDDVTDFRRDYPTRESALADLAQAQSQLDAMEDK